VLEAGSVPLSPQNFHILEVEALLGLARDLGLRQQQSRRRPSMEVKYLKTMKTTKHFPKLNEGMCGHTPSIQILTNDKGKIVGLKLIW
jgi:hypothetical protein